MKDQGNHKKPRKFPINHLNSDKCQNDQQSYTGIIQTASQNSQLYVFLFSVLTTQTTYKCEGGRGIICEKYTTRTICHSYMQITRRDMSTRKSHWFLFHSFVARYVIKTNI